MEYAEFVVLLIDMFTYISASLVQSEMDTDQIDNNSGDDGAYLRSEGICGIRLPCGFISFLHFQSPSKRQHTGIERLTTSSSRCQPQKDS